MIEPFPGAAKASPIAEALTKAPITPPPAAELPDTGPPPKTGLVKALGHGGGVFWFQTPGGEVRGFTPGKLSKNEILGLFEAHSDQVFEVWPVEKTDAEGAVTVINWNVSKATKALLKAASMAGHFDPAHDLGGLGVWHVNELHDPDRVLCCYGAGVYLDNLDHLPGRHGDKIYPRRRAEGRPGIRPASNLDGDRLLALLELWNFSDAELMPKLLLGWIAAAQVPACLDWRSSIWVTGDRATGKSTLLKAVCSLFGPDGIGKTADATYAGLRGKLAGAAKPLAIDELEADGDAEKALEISKLVRITATRNGGTVDRGTKDGGHTAQRLDTCFLISSILRPPLRPADLDRLSLLELEAAPGGAKAEEKLRREMAAVIELGPMVRRRVIDDFRRFRLLIVAFSHRLVSIGHSTRAADQTAPLLAGAFFLTHDGEPAAEILEAWCDLVPIGRPDEIEMAEHDLVLRHLLTTPNPSWRAGDQDLVGDLIAEALSNSPDASPKLLKTIGLALTDADGVPCSGARAREGGCLAIATVHRGLEALFAGTGWVGKTGRTGAWVQAMLRLEGARRGDKQIHMGGATCRVILIPLKAINPAMKHPEITNGDGPVMEPDDPGPAEPVGF